MFGLNCGFDLKNIADLRAIWGGGGAEHMGELPGAFINTLNVIYQIRQRRCSHKSNFHCILLCTLVSTVITRDF